MVLGEKTLRNESRVQGKLHRSGAMCTSCYIMNIYVLKERLERESLVILCCDIAFLVCAIKSVLWE